MPVVLEQHGEERDGYLLACGDERIAFSGIRLGGPFSGEGQKIVGVAVAGGKDGNDLVAVVQTPFHLGQYLFWHSRSATEVPPNF